MLKTILITFTTTAGALALAANLFLNTILGVFGLAATSVETLNNLRTSQGIIEAMKQRHTRKKNRKTKRFVKRSGRRVASTALAAATVGTVALAAVMTSMAISDYCDEKRTLQEDANLLYGTDVAFDLERCLYESADDAKAIIAEATDTVATKVSKAFESTANTEARCGLTVSVRALQPVQGATNAVDVHFF